MIKSFQFLFIGFAKTFNIYYLIFYYTIYFAVHIINGLKFKIIIQYFGLLISNVRIFD